jgi:carbon monoxide dehydrogenase subunit G
MVVLLRQHKHALYGRAVGVGAALVIALSSQAVAGDGSRTMGFAVTSWLTASYETDDGKEECPQGFAEDTNQIYMKTLSPEKLKEHTGNGTIDVAVDGPGRRRAIERGPNGEDVCWNPTAVKDPPMRIVRGAKGFGLDLDGVGSGKKTPNTCAHKNFTSVDGKNTSIDNQWYRLIGCTLGWRSSSGAYIEKSGDTEMRDNGHALLLEISDVDDPRNDNDVTVDIYQAVEFLVKDATGTGEILPGASYHTVDGVHFKTKGRISNGQLSTEPVDFQFSYDYSTYAAYTTIRGMRFQLDIAPDGRRATGFLAGYREIDNIWKSMARIAYLASMGHFSCPAVYAAAKELADGYPDPKTGECTALSAAYNIKAVSAYIIHERQNADSRSSIISQAGR